MIIIMIVIVIVVVMIVIILMILIIVKQVKPEIGWQKEGKPRQMVCAARAAWPKP